MNNNHIHTSRLQDGAAQAGGNHQFPVKTRFMEVFHAEYKGSTLSPELLADFHPLYNILSKIDNFKEGNNGNSFATQSFRPKQAELIANFMNKLPENFPRTKEFLENARLELIMASTGSVH